MELCCRHKRRFGFGFLSSRYGCTDRADDISAAVVTQLETSGNYNVLLGLRHRYKGHPLRCMQKPVRRGTIQVAQ